MDHKAVERAAADFARPALPFLATTGASAVAYAAGLLLVQVRRCSLHMQVSEQVGPAKGCSGLCAASAALPGNHSRLGCSLRRSPAPGAGAPLQRSLHMR